VISKREILDTAARLNLNPHVVEKDYALGWLLAGIFAHDALPGSWVFKGGTCLKKCYFETYRFSEDLDFTLTDASHLQGDFLQRVFSEISEWIYENCGLEFPADSQRFDIYENPRGNLNCQGKLSYRGPVSPSAGGLPRVKLDLTADERLVLLPVRVPIFHPYSDSPEDGIDVLAYAYEEAFAEKVRALAERTRPRDLYDVINLYGNETARPAASVLLDILRQKCHFKGIAVPKAGDLDGYKSDLEGAWASMLQRQLPALPPVASFWEVLPAFFAWLAGGEAPVVPAAFTLGAGESVIRERTLRLPLGGMAQSHIEVIRFAAANRLCVDLEYQRSTRRIEPYSLRRTQEGNILLHAWSVDRNAHRSYRVDRIEGARITGQTFSPRYAVELTPEGPVRVPPTQRSSSAGILGGTSRTGSLSRPARRGRARSSSSLSYGPAYTYQCPVCGKKFRRKTQSSRLNPHKTPDGFRCSGRTGFLVSID
jgi:predicted nucleotidyltransferase component of viral defense system